MIKRKPSKKQWKKMWADLVEGIVVPPGFEKSTYTDKQWKGNHFEVLSLEKSKDITIEIHLSDMPDTWCFATGHVTFTTKLGTRTFDRLGVDDSFYINPPEKGEPGIVESTNTTIREQLERIVKSRETMERSETVPQIGFTVTPERKAEVTRQLKSGKTFSFTPSGFGTGYLLMTRPTSRYSERAKPELAKFFDVPAVYFDRMDCD